MQIRKIITLILAFCLILSLTACAKDRDLQKEREAQTSAIPTDNPEGAENADDPADAPQNEKPLPTASSSDVELYICTTSSETFVCNAYGQKAAGYSVDADKNIVDTDKNIIVAAANTEAFVPLTEIRFSSQTVEATLSAKEDPTEENPDITEVNQYPVVVTLQLTGAPSDATNKVVILSSSALGIAEIKPNNNAKIIAEGDFNLQPGEIAIELSEDGATRVLITVKAQGEAIIKARSLSGTAAAECVLKVENGELTSQDLGSEAGLTDMIFASGDPTIHVHNYTKVVVDPTPYEKGYTLYICACGHSYKDNYTSPLPMPSPEPTAHVHLYEEFVVAPTATERGYTLHVCECGDSYKDCFVDPTGN